MKKAKIIVIIVAGLVLMPFMSSTVCFSIDEQESLMPPVIQNLKQKTPRAGQSINTKLNKLFVLGENMTAKIENEDLEIQIAKFINSPAPGGTQGLWTGQGISFVYRHAGETKTGVNMVQAFGYKITIIDTDNKTYAKLKVSKM